MDIADRIDPAWVAGMQAEIEAAKVTLRRVQRLTSDKAVDHCRRMLRALRHELGTELHADRCRRVGLPIGSSAAQCRALEQQ